MAIRTVFSSGYDYGEPSVYEVADLREGLLAEFHHSVCAARSRQAKKIRYVCTICRAPFLLQ